MVRSYTAETALGLALCAFACAADARADNGYQPYYSDPRDSILYSNMAPPEQAGVIPAPAYAPGKPTTWQDPQVTVQEPRRESPMAVPSDWQSQSPLFHFNNDAWIAAGTSLYNYKESVTPLPDSEHGWLGSVAAGGSYLTHDNLYAALDGAVAFGNAHYNGALLASPSVPYEGTTHETTTTADGKIGQGFPVGGNAMLIPYVDVGFRYWDRHLSAGQTEDYHNFDVLGGMMVQIAPTDRLFLMAYGSAGSTLAGRMTANNAYSYQLGDSAMYKVGGKIAYNLTQRVELFSTLDYDHFRYSQSPLAGNSSYEPGSGTNDTTMRFGVGYHFR